MKRNHARAVAVAALCSALAAPAAPALAAQGDSHRTDYGSYRPDASTTGAREGLRLYQGDMVVTRDGAVVRGLEITGTLKIKADDVQVRDVVVRGGDRGANYRGAILSALEGDQVGAVIADVTVAPSHPVVGMNCVQLSHAKMVRADVSGCTDGVVAYGDDVAMYGNWVHDLRHYAVDPAQKDGSHDDALQVEGGARTTVVGNDLSGAHNAAVMVTQNHARVSALRVERNWLDGGYITLNTSEKAKGAYTGFTLGDNVFGGHQANPYGVAAVITPSTRAAMRAWNNVDASTGREAKVSDAGS